MRTQIETSLPRPSVTPRVEILAALVNLILDWGEPTDAQEEITRTDGEKENEVDDADK